MHNVQHIYDINIESIDSCISLEEGYIENFSQLRVNIPKLMSAIPIGEPDNWKVGLSSGIFVNDDKPNVTNIITECNYYTLSKSTTEIYMERVRALMEMDPIYIGIGTRLTLLCHNKNIREMYVSYYEGKHM